MVDAVTDVAQAFVKARKAGTALSKYPGTRPSTLGDAYAIQDAALGIWDRTVAGWKVGKIPPPKDAELGANRLVGPVFADTIFEAGETPTVMPIFHEGFAAAEAEFMMRIAPLDGAAPPADNMQAMDWVDEIRIGIEIASSPYPAINIDGPCVTISDHGNNAGVVLGPEVSRSEWGRLNDIEVTTVIDGETVGTATTATMLDGPFGAVRFLLRNLHERGIEPTPGSWISSGAITGVHEAGPGASIVCRFAGLGEVKAKLA